MTNRVLLDNSGLKISKPGVDVLTAGSIGLQFSSDWSGMPIAQSGTVTASWTTAGLTGRYETTVTLTKTYASIPYVMFFWVIGSARVPIGVGNGFIYQIDRNDGGGSTSGPLYNSRLGINARVYVDKINFRMVWRKYSSGVVTPSVTLEYIVFENNL